MRWLHMMVDSSHLSISTYPVMTEELLTISNRCSAVVRIIPVIKPTTVQSSESPQDNTGARREVSSRFT